ncbi:hypothetical protein YC2023_043904 [Brassica napus]
MMMIDDRRITRAGTMMMIDPNEDENIIDSELVPSSLAAIAPILRVANDIEADNPSLLTSVASMPLRGLIQWIQHQVDEESVNLKPIYCTNYKRRNRRVIPMKFRRTIRISMRII